MLKVNDIHTFYGSIEALKGVSLDVKEGEIVAMIGANGAGKTTALMTISAILKPKKGSVYFKGERIDTLPAHEIVKRGISHVPEGRRIFPNLTVMENLEMGGYLEKDRKKIAERLEWIFSYFPILSERQKQYGGTLSGGEQQMLAIGRALMGNPDMLLLDEPSLGLAPIIVMKIFSIIKEINKTGTTILLVEQNAQAALRLAHRAYVLETGRMVLTDTAANLLSNPKIKEAYLAG